MDKKNDPTIATVPERIRGAIAAVLTITCFSISCNNTDAQWQVTFLVAGLLYFLTTIVFVFDKFDGT
ncbi:hypothetical protein BH11CYA1_BH11CYA1_06520 [soil metagenome]